MGKVEVRGNLQPCLAELYVSLPPREEDELVWDSLSGVGKVMEMLLWLFEFVLVEFGACLAPLGLLSAACLSSLVITSDVAERGSRG